MKALRLVVIGVRCDAAKIAASDQGTKKFQPCQEQSDVVTGGDEDDVDRVAVSPLEPVTLESSVGLHVSDDRFYGASPSEVALDGGRSDVRTAVEKSATVAAG